VEVKLRVTVYRSARLRVDDSTLVCVLNTIIRQSWGAHTDESVVQRRSRITFISKAPWFPEKHAFWRTPVFPHRLSGKRSI